MEMQQNFTPGKFKCLNNSSFLLGVKDLLSCLEAEDLFSIAQTASAKKLIVEDKQDAIDIILIYTPDLDQFFSYRKITSKVLTQYLNFNHVILRGNTTNQHLISSVKDLWVKKFSPKSDGNIEEKYEKESKIENDSIKSDSTAVSTVSSSKFYIKSDEFARSFAEWFYSRLNNVNNKCSDSEQLNSSMFCSNSSSDLFIINNSSLLEEFHSVGEKECLQSLLEIITKYELSFSPNLENGTQAVKSAHGLVKILSCGTLHKDKEFIGIFEQEFGVVQNPVDKNWKIFFTKLNLKTSVKQIMPCLPPSSVFKIECL